MLPAVVTWLPLATSPPRPLTAEDRFSLFVDEPYWLLGGILFEVAARRYQRSAHAWATHASWRR